MTFLGNSPVNLDLGGLEVRRTVFVQLGIFSCDKPLAIYTVKDIDVEYKYTHDLEESDRLVGTIDVGIGIGIGIGIEIEIEQSPETMGIVKCLCFHLPFVNHSNQINSTQTLNSVVSCHVMDNSRFR